MTTEQQIRALAELDGLSRSEQHDYDAWADYPHGVDCTQRFWECNGRLIEQRKLNYLTSYDAIIPLVQKHWSECGYHVSLRDNPAQLCEALLRATGKWTTE